jgi:hypothetical protein
MLTIPFLPSNSSSLLGNLCSLRRSELSSPRLTTLEPPFAAKSDGGRVFSVLGLGFFLGLDLARGFAHDLRGEFVQV